MHKCPQTGKDTPDTEPRRGQRKIYFNANARGAAFLLRKRHSDPAYNELARVNRNARRKARAKNGLCIECGTPADKYRCQNCSERNGR